MKSHTHSVGVYYYDVDCAGIVYHGQYQRYLEEGRTEWFKAQGFDLLPLHEQGIFFAVTELNLQYHRPAFLGDCLQVITKLVKLGAVRMVYEQVIQRGEGDSLCRLAVGHVTLCCTNEELKPIRIPPFILEGVMPS